MNDSQLPDYYEALQVSPRADGDTLQRVFRHLAKRFHPDNTESGDAERFRQLMESYQVLSDLEQRARYDARYQQAQEARWRVFDQESAVSDIASDRQMRIAILSVLYTARRNDADHPGMGIIQLERLLGCPEEHMKFHLWYLRENGWVQRLENGMLAITASGADRVMDLGGPVRDAHHLLQAGRQDGAPAAAL